jgi:2-polyprenyl-6-hydroxyphenyl methylase/3-demethylubiquinone-9 3-methyltransferase
VPVTDKRAGRRVSFSFGENWLKYLDEMPAEAIERHAAYVADWLGSDLSGLRILDIGCGQGLFSLTAHRFGANVVAFDADPASVAATARLRAFDGDPPNWEVLRGSILDPEFVSRLGVFHVVASWGVLHHTGRLWEALDAAASRVAPGGLLFIALYHRTPQSGRSLRTKKLYSWLPGPGKSVFRAAYASGKIAKHLVVRRSLRQFRDYSLERGMTWRRDVEDWLGGLPYEVSSPGEVLERLRPKRFTLERLKDGVGEGGNDVYLLRKAAD